MKLDDLSMNDRQAVADFTAFLNGTPACLICMTPSTECKGDCCPNCRHGRRQQVEGPARSEFHARPSIVYATPAPVADPDTTNQWDPKKREA